MVDADRAAAEMAGGGRAARGRKSSRTQGRNAEGEARLYRALSSLVIIPRAQRAASVSPND